MIYGEAIEKQLVNWIYERGFITRMWSHRQDLDHLLMFVFSPLYHSGWLKKCVSKMYLQELRECGVTNNDVPPSEVIIPVPRTNAYLVHLVHLANACHLQCKVANSFTIKMTSIWSQKNEVIPKGPRSRGISFFPFYIFTIINHWMNISIH